MKLIHPLAALLLAAPLGLASPNSPERTELNRHAIAINSEGRAIDPTVAISSRRDVKLSQKGYALQLDALFKGIEEQARAGKLTKKAVFLWVHGGNNSITGAIKRADRLIEPITEEGYYPVSICWSANLPSAWWEQMAYVRNGVNFRGTPNQWWTYATAPVYVATEFATAIVRFPRNALDKLHSTFKPVVPRAYDTIKTADFRYQSLQKREEYFKGGGVADAALQRHPEMRVTMEAEASGAEVRRGSTRPVEPGSPEFVAAKWWQRYAQDRPMTVSRGERADDPGAFAVNAATYTATIPTKTAVLSVFATGGASAWNMLNRRCKAMFHHTNSFRPGSQAYYNETDDDLADSEHTGVGALAVFLRRLELFCQKHPGIQVVAVGHSMGSIVINEAIRSFPRVPYREVVYMAAACSIRDFDEAVVPYLRKHRRTQFYNLCLHPRAEDRESNFYDLVPRGSFLVWIDEFLEHPESFPDRTLGNFENVMLASKMFHPRLHGQMHMSALGAGPGQPGPQKHGGFSAEEFWREGFWKRRGWEKWPPSAAAPAARKRTSQP